ncbi:MAG: histidine phosphatase family protein [Firmicutes bacterium]|nr:histidine phosphatase family protein [Bacillota bacterium]
MFYFIRHGETALNAIDGINEFDTPLNEKGREQVIASSEKLKGLGIEYVYASDTLRTVQTAEIVNKVAELNLEIQLDARLREFGLGDFEGVGKLEELKSRYNEIYRDPEKFGVEKPEDAFNRIASFFADMEKKNLTENACVVCHGGIMHMINYVYHNSEFNLKHFTKLASKEFKNAEIMQLDLTIPRDKRQNYS